MAISSSTLVLRSTTGTMMVATIALLTSSASVVNAVWVYSWPYGDSNSCKCEERDVSGTRYLEFGSAADCLAAFSTEEAEYCLYEGDGLSQHKCSSAISVAPGYFNSDCKTVCTEVLTGYIEQTEFYATCDLQMVLEMDDVTSVPITGGASTGKGSELSDNGSKTCFTNWVYGWSDYNPHNTVQAAPIGTYNDVETAHACQELCQFTAQCAYFSWRAHCDDADNVATSNGYQSPVGTCLLYDKAYMDGVLNTPMGNLDDMSLAGGSKYCDIETYKTAGCARASNLQTSSVDSFNPFETPVFEECLMCGCVAKCGWKSTSHVTGPRWCGDETYNVCNYPMSDFTTTTTTPSCPTQTCVEEPQTTTGESASATKAMRGIAIDTTTGIELDTTTIPQTTTTGIELETTTGIELDSTLN